MNDMTRSVDYEIPDEIVRKALDGYCSVPTYGTYQGQFDAMRAALQAVVTADGGFRAAVEADVAMIEDGIAKSRRPDREGFLVFSRIRELLAAHPAAHAVSVDTAESTASTSAVPQPVDREALERVIGKAFEHEQDTDIFDGDDGGYVVGCSGCATLGWPCGSVRAATDAVLAVLAGEQEQVGSQREQARQAMMDGLVAAAEEQERPEIAQWLRDVR